MPPAALSHSDVSPLQAAQFVRDKLWDPETSRLRRSFRLGPSAAAGYADDYAYLISGLLDLYQVCHPQGSCSHPAQQGPASKRRQRAHSIT